MYSILIVDDNEIDLLIAKKNLEMSGELGDIFVSSNGQDALDSIEEINPDYVLLDINMPILDGWGFLDSFGLDYLEDYRKPTVIMLSSSIDEEDSKRALENPSVSQYLVKPLNALKIQQFLDNNTLN